MRRLLPPPDSPDDVEVDALAAYTVERTPHADGRPWVGVCMVQSLDGSTVVAGRSGPLSSPADAAVIQALRQLADAVLVGAGTVRDEGYGPPRKAGQRIAVVSRRGWLDYGAALFTSGAGLAVLPAGAPEPPEHVEAIRAGDDDVDLALALRLMRERFGADFVQVEGGAGLNASMVAEDLVDEWNVTISPAVVGGTGPRVTAGAPDVMQPLRLAHLLEDDGFLFARYLR